MRSAGKRAIGLLAVGWASWFWTWTARIMLSSVIPGIAGEMSLTPMEAGLLAAALNAGWAAGTFSLGLLGSMIDASLVAVVSLAIGSLAVMLVSPAASLPALLALFALAGLLMGGFSPNSVVVVASSFKKERRGGAMGVFDTAVPLGLSAGGLIVAYLYPSLGWRGLALYWGALGLVLSVMLRLLSTVRARRRRARVSLKLLAPFLIAYMGSVATGVGLVVYMPLFLTAFVGLSVADAAWTVGFSRIFGVAGQVVSGWLSDKYGRWRVLIAINALLVLTSALVALLARSPLVVYALILNFAVTSPFYPVLLVTMYEVFGEATSAALGAAMSVGHIVGSSLIIPVMVHLDYHVYPSLGLWMVPALLAAGLAALGTAKRKRAPTGTSRAV